MSKKSRHRRTPDQHRRQSVVAAAAMAMALGGALAAAFVSTGTASADDLLGSAGNDAVTDVAQTAAALPAQDANDDAFTNLIAGIDGNAFTADGDPNDLLGILASEINTDLANTVYGPEINEIATQIVCADTPSCVDSLSITPLATGDDPFTAALQYWEQLTSAFIAPASGADDYLATIASAADAEVADTVLGPELYTIVEQIISGLNTIDPAAFVP
jgi:hypothetical protein